MYKSVNRLISLLVLLFNINQNFVLAQGLFNVKGDGGKALYGCSFLNITETRMERCLAKCLENCLCMSFQMCEQEKCQLCSSDKEQNPSAFRERKECTYYAFQKDLAKVKNQQCQKSCSTGINCCATSNPCMNNGTCKPTSPTNTTTRFECKCPVGYTGDICQHPIKSCRGYINGSRVAGKYKVLDDNMKPFEVYCVFKTDETSAWTLIQSYHLQNKTQFQEPFFVDDPVNEDSPGWGSYRLSKCRMQSIKKDSIVWRMTCQYDPASLRYKDYIKGRNNELDILTYNGSGCMTSKRIKIRHNTCRNCRIMVVQGPEKTFHFKSCDTKCRSSPLGGCGTCGRDEDNFGFYNCTNPAHPCSATNTSTTQTWFGSWFGYR